MRKKCLFGFIILTMTGLFCFLPDITSADNLIVIGNKSIPVSKLSHNDIQNIYLGKKKVWANGLKVEMSVLIEGDITNRFLTGYLKKNTHTFNNYWKKQLFTGGGKPPVVFEREKDLVEFVTKTKGAVGYLSSQSTIDNVIILSVLQ